MAAAATAEPAVDPPAPPARSWYDWESIGAFVACFVFSVIISRRLLDPTVYSDDAFVHQYWMWHWRDSGLFNDPLTHLLRDSARYPDGYQALFWLASHVANPITFGEWLGVFLMAVSTWFIFLICREQTTWRPAGWIAGALFLALIDIHRFYGGFQRAFIQPIVLLTVLLLLKRQPLWAALVAAVGALFYPPASLLAVAVIIFCTVTWEGRRPHIDRKLLPWTVLAGVLALIAVLLPDQLKGGAPAQLSESMARKFPEFNRLGTLHFFESDPITYLTQNRSGFDLRGAGSILVIAAIALLVFRPANARALRQQVWAMPIVSLILFTIAQLVLFKLYLPHRYTYPIVAFAAIAVGVSLKPTFEAVWARRHGGWGAFGLLVAPLVVTTLAIWVFPLGPKEPWDNFISPVSIAVAVGTVVAAAAVVLVLQHTETAGRAALAAALAGIGLTALIAFVPERYERGTDCPTGQTIQYLRTLPKDAIIAGDPIDLKCVPATTRRAVVISTQLAPSYEKAYFLMGRQRMFDQLDAIYGSNPQAIVKLGQKYGATDLWIRRGSILRQWQHKGGPWRAWSRPYGTYVKRLVAHEPKPASLQLPKSCLKFQKGPNEVYSIPCVTKALA
jgi:hypothetical protein